MPALFDSTPNLHNFATQYTSLLAQDITISLITVVFNAENTIGRCIRSAISQTYKKVEYIIIDGSSTDNTLQIINNYKDHLAVIVSEPDRGIYDAMNKGIRLATGDVVGMLNADDCFAYDGVLAKIADAFQRHDARITYADLDFIDTNNRIVRKWRSGSYTYGMFNRGWMPPHPTFYCRRELFHHFGLYKLDYGSAADYELMLRFMHFHHINAFYIKSVIILMKNGGISNQNLSSHVKGLLHDYRAMRNNGVSLPCLTVFLKPLRKITQFFGIA